MYKGKDGELDATSEGNLFNKTHTNGMQFKPIIFNSNEQLEVLQVFDPSHLMFTNFTGNKVVER